MPVTRDLDRLAYTTRAAALAVCAVLVASPLASCGVPPAEAPALEMPVEADARARLDDALRLAGERRYQEAIDAFEQVRAERPDAIESLDGLKLAVVHAVASSRETHGEFCRWLADRYPAPELPTDAERSVKGCVIVSGWGTADDLERAVARTRFAVDAADGQGQGDLLPWFHVSLGLAEYRAGRFDDASAWASRSTGDESPYIRSLALVVQAMAEHRRGDHAKSSALLDHARSVIAAFPGPGTSGYEQEWTDILVSRRVLDEAEGLIAAG
jgi:hypothetical protein